MAGTLQLLSLYIAVSIYSVSAMKHYRNCIVGAGPAGLQMGYFFERGGRDYKIFERANVAGSFFLKYPRHRNLISINKRHTGRTNKEFNLRHDWNSLLSDDESLLMKHYSKKFFPTADSLVKYLNDYAIKLKLKIQYDTYIERISKNNKTKTFHLKDQNSVMYSCDCLIMSTGLWLENVPKDVVGIEHTEGYRNVSINPDDFEGQSVLILGRGNAAFEIAENIMGATNHVHMLSRGRLRLSWETHYVGDVRAVNDGPIDTYQLKSLDAQLEASTDRIEFAKKNGKIFVDAPALNEYFDNFALREPYDRVIRCMGFKFDFSVFRKSIKPKKSRISNKYPAIKPNYESKKTEGIFFAGTNSHSLDWRKSAGGFIHGFRYTTRALFHLLEWRNYQVKWPSSILNMDDLMNHIIKRLNEASGTYQMFSTLADIIVFRNNDTFEYYEEVPIDLLQAFEEHTGHTFPRGIVVNLEYGKGFSEPGSDPFRYGRAVGSAEDAHDSNFLHPVLYYYENGSDSLIGRKTLPQPDRKHHIVEDFLTEWNAILTHHLPLRWFLETVSRMDLRNFYSESCFKYAMTSITIPSTCHYQYMNGQMIPRPANSKPHKRFSSKKKPRIPVEPSKSAYSRTFEL